MAEDCLFCAIAAGNIPAKVVYSDSRTLAFLDIAPRSPGHTVVIPRMHASTLADLPNNEIEPLFSAVQTVSRMLKNALAPDGFTIGMNEGAVSGQTVPHLHVHLMPRFTGDGGGSIHSVVHNSPKENLDELIARITKAVPQI